MIREERRIMETFSDDEVRETEHNHLFGQQAGFRKASKQAGLDTRAFHLLLGKEAGAAGEDEAED